MIEVVKKNNRKSKKNINLFDFRLVENTDGFLCESYPLKFLIPTKLTNSQIVKIASFRARERLPMLTFAYKFSENGEQRFINLKQKIHNQEIL
jgi:hypothetical protein